MSSVRMVTIRRRRLVAGLPALALCVLMAGCHRRVVVPTLPPVLKAPDVAPPTPASPSMESAPPDSITHAPPVKVTESKPVRRVRRSTKTASAAPAAPPSEVAATVPPGVTTASMLGALTTGGEVSQKAQQETSEMIASNERRLQTLSGTRARDQPAQLKEVRRFLDQAKEAMGSGDAEGAKTLATKAKLLLDDLEKWAAN